MDLTYIIISIFLILVTLFALSFPFALPAFYIRRHILSEQYAQAVQTQYDNIVLYNASGTVVAYADLTYAMQSIQVTVEYTYILALGGLNISFNGSSPQSFTSQQYLQYQNEHPINSSLPIFYNPQLPKNSFLQAEDYRQYFMKEYPITPPGDPLFRDSTVYLCISGGMFVAITIAVISTGRRFLIFFPCYQEGEYPADIASKTPKETPSSSSASETDTPAKTFKTALPYPPTIDTKQCEV